MLRNTLLYDHLDWWNAHGFEFDENAKSKASMAQQESLMKLFAVSYSHFVLFLGGCIEPMDLALVWLSETNKNGEKKWEDNY